MSKDNQQLAFNLNPVRGKQKLPTKKQLTVRLSQEVVDFFKEEGRGWQTRMNDVLRDHVYQEKKKRARALAKAQSASKRPLAKKNSSG